MNKRLRLRRRLMLLALLAIAYPILNHGVDMLGWFKKKEVFLSSEVNGVIIKNGTPLANLEVTRSLMYIDEKDHIDVAITDSAGHFHFPQKSIRSSIPNRLFSEDRVSQQITVVQNNELLPIWFANHIGIEEVPEFSKKLAFMNCELTNKRVSFQFRNINSEHNDHIASSICRWQTDYKPIWLYDGESEYRVNNYDLNDLSKRK
ncbi:hypothetical protein FLM48_00450 [Shewanella sp. Scap07]|uniref:DUF6795 domain-containing protein n=1 Tax=Shewanella sp. Scap07 TaxID=2589987 RepID=UPI0015B8D96E|nr:DUF6795 domain-containing protein [Shewanella sp. Scap07]QLE83690.1 hypothetical protein FLM48_00450 [Shewanella sp. Scap07]